MKEIEPNENTKPSYDGRLYYYKIVSSYIQNISMLSYNSEFMGWFNQIQQLYSLVSPYILNKDKLELDKSLQKVENNIDILMNYLSFNNPNKAFAQRQLQKMLQKLTNDLYNSAKHMLLPIKDMEEGEYDSEQFFGESDL